MPGLIQAQDFDHGGQRVAYYDTTAGNSGGAYRNTDVDIEVTKDVSGGHNVGWIQAGEWLEYTVNVAAAGSYQLEARVASPSNGGRFHVAFGGVNKTGTLSIPNTGGWQTWTTITSTVQLEAGEQVMRVAFDTNAANGFVGNLNWIELTRVQASFSGVPSAVPGLIQAQDFDHGGQDVAYYDLTAGNAGGAYRNTDVDIQPTSDVGGGHNVGWIQAGEWLEYTVNVAAAGSYQLEARVASPSSGGRFHVAFGGENKTGTLSIPNTGGWQTWTTITSTVQLEAGEQIMRVAFDTNAANGFVGNLNWIKLTATDPPPPPPDSNQSVTGFSLINADTNQVVPGFESISHQTTINLATLPTQNLNIRANTTSNSLGSIKFGFAGNDNFRIENEAPYALFGDTNGNYAAGTLPFGINKLTATAYSGRGANGKAEPPVQIAFTVINQADSIPTELFASAGGPYTGKEGSPVALKASASGGTGELSYAWDLNNDGTFETPGQNVSHAFPDNGEYQVRLRVTDFLGQFVIASTIVSVANVAPTASAGGPYSATVGQSLTFQGSAYDPSPIDTAAGFTYAWDFGDGHTSSVLTPSHIYAAAGIYTVSLTVSDKDGGTHTDTTTVRVYGPDGNHVGLANIGLTPGWATFGQALPQGAARGGLKLGDLVTQTDVKTTWPDGSIRFAIVSAAVPVTGNYTLTEAAPSTGSFVPQVPNASVRLTIGGQVFTATLPQGVSNDTWLAGPLVIEGRQVVAPVGPNGAAHPFLRVVFDTRIYSDGKARVDVTVENVFDLAGATAVTYDVAIAVNGQTVFTKSSVTHHYLTRWRKVFTTGGLAESAVTPDFEPVHQANALPRYMPDIYNTVSSPTGADYDILQRGSLTNPMNSVGGRPEIAWYPDWTARYLVHKNPTQRAFVLAHGDLAGSWPVHVRNPDGSFISIDARPNFWLDHRAAEGDKPAGNLDARGPLRPEVAHQPSLAYVPYLLTGDRYYADEMADWAHFCLQFPWPVAHHRNGSQGLLTGTETRAIAWGLRNLVDAAAYLPDGDPAKPYITSKIHNNLDRLETVIFGNAGPLGTHFGSQPAFWQNNYVAWAIDHANKQGFSGALNLRDGIAATQVTIYTHPDIPGNYRAMSWMKLAESGRWYTSWAEVIANNDPPKHGIWGMYGADGRVASLIARANGHPDAQKALDWLEPQWGADPNHDLRKRAGWALDESEFGG